MSLKSVSSFTDRLVSNRQLREDDHLKQSNEQKCQCGEIKCLTELCGGRRLTNSRCSTWSPSMKEVGLQPNIEQRCPMNYHSLEQQ